MKTRYWVIVGFLAFGYNLYSQNLVLNPSFEEVYYCPFMELDTTLAKYWHKPHGGTTDYYNSCSKISKWGVPSNWMGTYKARTGIAYCGIIPISPSGYMEHLQGSLNDTLKKGERYKISFWVRFADSASYFSVWKIGAHLSKKRILDKGFLSYEVKYQDLIVPAFYPHIENEAGKFIIDTNWIEIKGEYIAKGGERYITIGCFYGDNEELQEQLNKYFASIKKRGSGKVPFFKKYWLNKNSSRDKELSKINEDNPYYFIDDVSVELIAN